MPELPEVETVCRALAPSLVGNQIRTVVIRHTQLRWPIASKLSELSNEPMVSLQRQAKYLLLQLSQGWLIIHLGMSGTLRLLPAKTAVNKHDHIDLQLACGQLLRFTDPRRFGAWLWCEDPWQHRLLQHLGVEPLSPAFTGTYLAQAAQGQRMAIKPWLMKSNVVVGIGNIYASEALYQAKISPLCLAGALDQIAINRLVDSIRLILAQAIAQGGSTLRDFRQTNGKLGYFTQQHEVYNRKNQPCRHCTTPIVQLRQGQRSTFYCPSCQRGW